MPAGRRRRGPVRRVLKSFEFPKQPGSSSYPLGLLHLNEETLEFRRKGVGIDHCRRKQIRRRPRISSFVLSDAAEALMNRQTDLVDLLAVDHHRLDPAGHISLGYVSAARAGYFDFFAASNSQLIGELNRNLDKRL